MLDRRTFPATFEENKRKLEEERKLIDKLLEEIKGASLYSRLKNEQKKYARTGNWRLGHSWAELAQIAGFDKNYFRYIYRYLCSYAHTDNLSVFQLAQATDRKTQLEMVETWRGVGLVLMSHFIFAYVSIYPKAQSVLAGLPDAAQTADIWNSIGRELKDESGG